MKPDVQYGHLLNIELRSYEIEVASLIWNTFRPLRAQELTNTLAVCTTLTTNAAMMQFFDDWTTLCSKVLVTYLPRARNPVDRKSTATSVISHNFMLTYMKGEKTQESARQFASQAIFEHFNDKAEAFHL